LPIANLQLRRVWPQGIEKDLKIGNRQSAIGNRQ
jgi:hypothetical protein